MALFLFLFRMIGIQDASKPAPEHDFVLRMTMLVLVAIAVLNLIDTLRFRLTLASDSIAVRRGLGSRRLLRTQIRGWEEGRRRRNSTFRVIVLVPDKATGAKALRIPMVMNIDAAFTAWFEEVPHLL